MIDAFQGVLGAGVEGSAGGSSTSLPPRRRSRITWPTGPGNGWATTSAIVLMPPLRVAAPTSRSVRTARRMKRSGLRTSWRAVSQSSSGSLGTLSGTQRGVGGGGAPSGVVSRMAASMRAPEAPSMVAWWTLVSWATFVPPSTPSIT